jgi:hypothetical protein
MEQRVHLRKAGGFFGEVRITGLAAAHFAAPNLILPPRAVTCCGPARDSQSSNAELCVALKFERLPPSGRMRIRIQGLTVFDLCEIKCEAPGRDTFRAS